MQTATKLRAPLAALALVGLVGCVTPPAYGPISVETGQFGYRDSRNANGTHTILTVAPSAAMAHEFWDRRARELCGGGEFRKNIFRAHIPVVTQSGYVTGANGYGGSYTQDVYGSFYLEGYARCVAPAEATPDALSPSDEQPQSAG